MRRALLTIDDSPSGTTDDLVAFLAKQKIPAVFFCRGDRLENNPDPIVRAIQNGISIGNHAFSHTRFSTLTYEQGVDEIKRTQDLIDVAHQRAGIPQKHKSFRFPHMDRGCGGWVVDYDAVPKHREKLIALFSGGLNLDLTPPPADWVDKKSRLQDYLKAEGYQPLSNPAVTFPWYAETEMSKAVDAMFTYSTSDWMVTARHAGKWPYKTLEDLIKKINDDQDLQSAGSGHIILAHDQDELLPVVKALVAHMTGQDFAFEGVKT